MSVIRQKGTAHLVVIILILLGLVLGVWLVQNRTNILPSAQENNANLAPQTAFHLLTSENYSLAESTEGSDTAIAPMRTWFYPGEEIKVALAVSSDIDNANTFSAVINFPTDLLEVISIQKENNDPVLVPVGTESVTIEANTDSARSTTSSSEVMTIPSRGYCDKDAECGDGYFCAKHVWTCNENMPGCKSGVCVKKQLENEGCKIGGCSGQLCISAAEEEGIDNCQWKDEYACYQKAECEKQKDGKCGWTQTDQLQQCLKNPKDSKICPQVVTTACKQDYIACLRAPCPQPSQMCKDFPTPCDVPEGWEIQDSNLAERRYCLPENSCPDGYVCKQRSNCSANGQVCTSAYFFPECYPNPSPPMPIPSCKPIPSCVYSNPACDLYIDPNDPSWCRGQPSINDYFIRFWLPDTGFDNATGKITLSGGVSGQGVLTVPPVKPIMATIIFKAKKAGEANLQISEDSVILKSSDSQNILGHRGDLKIQIQDPAQQVVIKGDLDGDGVVSYRDLSILFSKWGSNDKQSLQSGDFKNADINGDGKVGLFDFSIILSHWGKGQKTDSN